MTTYTLNEKFNGIEITFDSKPAADIRSTLKENGFRWHNKKALWYAKNTPERLTLAEMLAEGKATKEKKTAKTTKAKANKFGVKVGDIFTASWGYDQTNVDFFQVIELVGTTSVRVREINLCMVEEDAIGPMSADRTYEVTNEIQPPASYSSFIKDQEKGDLKRLKSYAADGVSRPQFKLDSFADAWKVEADEITVYESWYA